MATSSVSTTGSGVTLTALPSIDPSSSLRTKQDQSVVPADRPAPTDQIVPALVGILKTADGTPSVTVRLRPPELGQVQIRIDQATGGAAHINITTDRPETLRLLQHDEPRLQQALDQAGVLSTGRTVSFQVVTQEQNVVTAFRPESITQDSRDSGQGQSGGPWRQNEDAQRDSGHGSTPDRGQPRARRFRAGLDITA